MSSPAAPSRAQVLKLYRQYLSTAQSFSSYNFRTYFLRRSRDLFRSNLLPPSQAASSSPHSKAGDTTTPASPAALTSAPPSILTSNTASSSSSPGSSSSSAAAASREATGAHQPQPSAAHSDVERVTAFYHTALKDLQVLRRSALINRMYEGERLVVERPRLIVGGGRAGVEASVGGGGQPVAGGPNSPPKSD
ncbi:hypothetical protein K437DRAFT_254320 [Tilletiaria anomala UBC 951]|uniref:Complex 1 LYR protein domain-containing protein n=1 Tax=Tilletiaria anomala (strain ATCC 24038 / CBS 436.72 / UBC 951) TaxID=1037660 RepID=A0A066WEJ6_TILAU|nr:uncharacterized protein K437DRAFT_254320 [Tilletiaria anomala UBC 951]KDN52337.1 hypothetical protein K437DRAFT_254320 [Tilletiaria anomala UBC 951]